MKYADSGVNIDAATRALARSKEAVRSTWDARVRNEIGAFGGLFQPAPGEPLLVASVDGVGTKVMVARMAGRYDTVGQDLVNHCVDDILVQGAEPLFFLDYFATARLERGRPARRSSPASPPACRRERLRPAGRRDGRDARRLPRRRIRSGRHDRGPGAARARDRRQRDRAPATASGACPAPACTPTATRWRARCCWSRPAWTWMTAAGTGRAPPSADSPAGRAPQLPARMCAPIWDACGRAAVHGLAHITGGGFYDNIPRVVPPRVCACTIDPRPWTVPPIFRLIAELGEVSDAGDVPRLQHGHRHGRGHRRGY